MFSGAQFSGRKKVELASNHQDCSHLSLSDIRVILALLSTAFLLGVLSNLHHNHVSKFRFRISGVFIRYQEFLDCLFFFAPNYVRFCVLVFPKHGLRSNLWLEGSERGWWTNIWTIWNNHSICINTIFF